MGRRYYRRPRRRVDTFDAYREITARRAGACDGCGAEVAPGDVIGWNATLRKTMCTACWSRWCDEVEQERQAERQAMDTIGRMGGGW